MDRRRMLAATGGTAIAAISGCLSVVPFDSPRPDDLLLSVAAEHDRERSLDALRVVRSGMEDSGFSIHTHERTQRYLRTSPDRFRTEVTWSSDEYDIGNVRVVEQSTEIVYQRTDGTVRIRESPGVSSGEHSLESVVDDYHLEYVGRDKHGLRDVEVIDAVAEVPGGDSRALSVQIGSTEYVLPFGSSDGGPEIGDTVRKRFWVDPDLPVPVKERTEMMAAEDSFLIDERGHYGISVDTEIDDEQFKVEPITEHVSVLKSIPSDRTRRTSSRSVITDELPFPLPDPDLPAGYEFDEVRVMEDESAGVVGARFWYEHGRNQPRLFLTISEVGLIEHPDSQIDALASTSGSMNGQAIRSFDVENVEWECGDRTYRIGSHPDRDLLVEIAESVTC